MAVSQEFQTALDNKDIMTVHIMLKDSLVVDPTFTEFGEMLKLAEQSLDSLYDKHDGEKLINDSQQWDKDYMDIQMVKAIRNFSRERIELLKNICAYLYETERASKPIIIEPQKPKSGPRTNSKKNNYESSTSARNRKDGEHLIIGGAVLIGVGILTEVTLITVAGVAAVVGGGIMIVNNK